MANYSPLRKAPNVSEYLANLNAIPSVHEASAQDGALQQQDGYGLEEDLALFTDTVFNFEPGEILDQSPLDYDPVQGDRIRQENVAGENIDGDNTNMNFATNYQYPDLPYVPTSDDNISPQLQNYQSPNQPFDLSFPSQSPTSPYNITSQQPHNHSDSSASARNGSNKRSASTDPASLEASSRVAAEEDKRRRNTAASARFRVKKKQREQALEKQAKEMTDRAEKLEQRIGELETENKWLRGLVIEKGTIGSEDVGEVFKKFGDDERSKKINKRGVGTTKGEESGKEATA